MAAVLHKAKTEETQQLARAWDRFDCCTVGTTIGWVPIPSDLVVQSLGCFVAVSEAIRSHFSSPNVPKWVPHFFFSADTWLADVVI